MIRLLNCVLVVILIGPSGWWPRIAGAETIPARGLVDARIREARYSSEQVYRLSGYVGYQIDLQFESGESFVGLGAGDIEGLAFTAQDNHLFLKPKAAVVATNLTVLTNRRHYQFDYTSADRHPDIDDREAMYALRFIYPSLPGESGGAGAAERVDRRLRNAEAGRTRNLDYHYCGAPELQPVSASDDGVHTRLRFGVRRELPALFVSNEDGSESLLNFSMQDGEVVIHRIARQFIVRRGKSIGCIVNKTYTGSGEALRSGTVAPDVERSTQGSTP